MASVVIPAHNESAVIGRLLEQLKTLVEQADYDVTVVANGCTDDTADIAASFGPGIRVLSIPVASKHEALKAGDRVALGFPRIYIDADVELTGRDIKALGEALRRPGTLAAAPQRDLVLVGRPWLVRWYYDVWERLPEVRTGIFGRGAIAVNEAGHSRIAVLPPLLADDLAASLAFSPSERVVVGQAHSIVHAPRTAGDLLYRRIRAATGVAQVERAEGAPDSTARTRFLDLFAIVFQKPTLAPKVLVFSVVAVLARIRAARAIRKNGYSNWLRDESSRC